MRLRWIIAFAEGLLREYAEAGSGALEKERTMWLRTERNADAERRHEWKVENEGVHDTRPGVGYRMESFKQWTSMESTARPPRLLKTVES